MVRRAAISFLLTTLGVAGSLCVAQDPNSSYEHLQFLEEFVGSWSYEGSWEDQGQYVGQELSEWALNKSLFITTGSYSIGGGQRIDYKQITTWDPIRTRIVTHGHDSRGNSMERVGTYDPDAKLWKRELCGSEAGQSLRYVVTQQKVAADEYRVRLSRAEQGDKDRPDITAIYTRAGAVPREIVKELEYLVGEWDYEGYHLHTKEPVKGKCIYQWAPGQHCLLWHQTWIDKTGLSHGVGIIGWDPSTNRLVEQDLYESGTFGRHSYRLRPDVWEADSQYVSPTGTLTLGKITMTKHGSAELEYRLFDYVGPLGSPGEAWLLTLHKVKPMTLEDFQTYGDAMVGEWEGEFVLSGDVPGTGKNGDKLRGHGTIVWAGDKRGLEIRWQFGLASGTTITFWDSQSSQIKETAFDSAGGVYQGHVVKEGDNWVATGVTVYPDGTRRSVTDSLAISDGGKTHIHAGTVFLNGNQQPDYRDIWHRVEK